MGKPVKRAIWVLSLLIGIISSEAYAARCGIDFAKVTRIYQYDDGNIFVEFDQNTSCNTAFPERLALHVNENQKFIMAAILQAVETQKYVSAAADDAVLIHGNSAHLINFGISR